MMLIVMVKKGKYYVYTYDEIKDIKNIKNYFEINLKEIGKIK